MCRCNFERLFLKQTNYSSLNFSEEGINDSLKRQYPDNSKKQLRNESMSDLLPNIDTLLRFAIDATAMVTLLFGVYYHRYRDKELVTTASMFNIFAFCVLTILSSVEFSVAAGFGLFAILALFSLRSEQITKIEITYFFGSISIAVICSVQGTTLPFVIMVVLLVLLGAYFLDHPRILKSADGVKVTLDKIDNYALSDPKRMRDELSATLGVDVMSYKITTLNYINDLAQISVFFRTPESKKGNRK